MDSPEEARGRRDLFVALGFLVLSLVVLNMPTDTQSRLSGLLCATVLRPFIAMQEAVVRARVRGQEAVTLQGRLDSLSALVTSQESLAEENARLRRLLGLRERAPGIFLAASVVRPGTAGSESLFLLDVGSEDGVRPGDPVVMAEGSIGLVGVIQQVRRRTSLGMDWSHPDFRASAMSSDGRVFGFVEPTGSENLQGLHRLILNGVPYYEPLDSGTLITTSGMGGVYPRGIPIGEVFRLEETEGEWRKAYWLEPVVETGMATHVLVMVQPSLSEEMVEALREPGSVSNDPDTGVGAPDPTSGGSGGWP